MAAEKRSRREMVQLAGAGVLGLAALQRGSPPRKQVFKDPTGTSDTLAAIRSGHLLFVSGIGGYYPSRRPGGPGDIKQQTADALDIMKALLERAGSSMADLLQVQVALVDSAEELGANERGLQQPRSRASSGAIVFRQHWIRATQASCCRSTRSPTSTELTLTQRRSLHFDQPVSWRDSDEIASTCHAPAASPAGSGLHGGAALVDLLRAGAGPGALPGRRGAAQRHPDAEPGAHPHARRCHAVCRCLPARERGSLPGHRLENPVQHRTCALRVRRGGLLRAAGICVRLPGRQRPTRIRWRVGTVPA